MRKFILMSAVLAFSVSINAFAKAESWYWGFGLGYGKASYPAVLDGSINSLNNTAGVSRRSTAVDLGFYWPVGQSTIMGPSITGMTDAWESGFSELRIVHTGIYLSTTHTFGSAPMEGFFLRGDLGFARIAVESGGFSSGSDYGLGANGGLGFGISLSDETRLVLQGIYSFRRVEGESYSNWAILVGPMF